MKLVELKAEMREANSEALGGGLAALVVDGGYRKVVHSDIKRFDHVRLLKLFLLLKHLWSM